MDTFVRMWIVVNGLNIRMLYNIRGRRAHAGPFCGEIKL